jgi:hypothetical protein
VFEAFGEFEEVDEVFEDAWEGAVVFGGDDVEACGGEDALLEGEHGGGLGGVDGGEEEFGGELFEAEEIGGGLRVAVEALEGARDLEGGEKARRRLGGRADDMSDTAYAGYQRFMRKLAVRGSF